MIQENLVKQVQEAMKAGDGLRVSTLRLLSSVLHNEEIDKHRKLTGEEELIVVRRQIKQREEAIELYKRGGRQDLVDKETEEAEILKEFLPEQMSERQLSDIVNKVIKETKNGDFGLVMREVMKQVAGRADGRVVSELVKERIS